MTTVPSFIPPRGPHPGAEAARILVVDDDPDILELALLALRSGGFIAEPCLDSGSAVPAAHAFRPHLILLDAMMPVVDGMTVLHELRSQLATATIPVVFLTARTDLESVRQYLTHGADGVIAKPFDPLSLCSQIDAFLGRE